MMKKITVVLFMVFLCGCASMGTWAKTRGDKLHVDKARNFKAMLPADWMRLNYYKDFLISRDGPALDLISVRRIRFGDKLEKTKRVFTKDMTPQELAEVEIDNIKANENVSRVEIISNKPVVIDGVPSYSFEYAYETVEGLPVKGVMSGCIQNERVCRIQFEAASQHYFSFTLKDYEKFINSFVFLK